MQAGPRPRPALPLFHLHPAAATHIKVQSACKCCPQHAGFWVDIKGLIYPASSPSLAVARPRRSCSKHLAPLSTCPGPWQIFNTTPCPACLRQQLVSWGFTAGSCRQRGWEESGTTGACPPQTPAKVQPLRSRA